MNKGIQDSAKAKESKKKKEKRSWKRQRTWGWAQKKPSENHEIFRTLTIVRRSSSSISLQRTFPQQLANNSCIWLCFHLKVGVWGLGNEDGTEKSASYVFHYDCATVFLWLPLFQHFLLDFLAQLLKVFVLKSNE